jgi:photosystem II stability/assembly factor-like uncharacterized protein
VQLRGTALVLLILLLTIGTSAQTPANRAAVIRSSLSLPPPLGAVLAAAADAAGNTYVTGYTRATAATTPGVFQPTPHGGGYDGFAAKFDAAGKLAWATFLGGSGGTGVAGRIAVPSEMGTAIAVDSAGNVYVAGVTPSRDFPTLNPFQAAGFTSRTGFIVKLDTSGHGVYSSYVGGAADDNFPTQIVATPLGETYILGQTHARDFQVSRHIGTPSSQSRAYVVYVGPTGQRRDALTLGGTSGVDVIRGAALDGTGALHIVGNTLSSDFPVIAAALPACTLTFGSCAASFVMKLAPNLGAPVYSTYLNDGDRRALDSGVVTGAAAVAIDGLGRAIVTGSTSAPNFPVLHPLQARAASADGFLVRFTPAGGIDFSTTFGGSDDDQFDAVQTDATGAIVVSGASRSLNFPLASPMAAHPDAGVIASSDAGGTWSRAADSLAGPRVTISGDPSTPQRLYTAWVEGTTSVFGRSEDLGRTWTRLPWPGRSANPSTPTTTTIFVGPAGTVYVVEDPFVDSLMRRSDDLGSSFTTIDQGTCCGVRAVAFGKMAFTPADPNRVYVVAQALAVRVSTDRGLTWASRSSGLPQEFANLPDLPATVDDLAASPTTVGTLWASVRSAIYKTTDDGVTWVQVRAPDANFSPTLSAGADGVTVYAGNRNDAVVSRDGGATWASFPIGPASPTAPGWRVVADAQRPNVVYAFRLTSIWKSVDYGQTWTDVSPKQFSRGTFNALVSWPASPDTLVVVSSVAFANVYARLVAGVGDSLQVESSTFLGALTGTSILAPDGDVLVLTAGTPYTLTRIGRGYPAFCGRALLPGLFAPASDVCAP